MDLSTYGRIKDIPPSLVSNIPRFEIWFTKEETKKLPFDIGERVKIEIKVNEKTYIGGLRYLRPSQVAWICPDLLDKENNKLPLSTVLIEAGFNKNDRINLNLSGAIVTVITRSNTFTWTTENHISAFKVLDKSAFLHRGTGIPKEIRPFFMEKDLTPGERRPISFVFQGQAYAAHIDMEGQDTARTRLFWNAAFTSLLKETFPHHYQQYSTNQTPDTQVILRLKRLSGFDSYEVSFTGEIPEDYLKQDIQSEEFEEKEPQKEGGVREYYGKRYERSPVNRQQAILIHGLSCNACGFNFEKVYGARGADYIEVHHVKPIHTYEQEQHVDPKTDLTTLCSNCHRMTHRDRNNVLSMATLRQLISELKGSAGE